jgi:hypothetical protein
MAKSKVVVTEETLRANGWVKMINGSWTRIKGRVVDFKKPEELGLPKKRIRQDSKPLLNQLETEFYHYITANRNDLLEGSPTILSQSIRFKLGNGIWYKPDFVLVRPEGTWTTYEVKGPKSWRGGFENLKVAAGQYPFIQWMLAWKEQGVWMTQKILP